MKKSYLWKKLSNFSLNIWIQPWHVQKFVFLITLFIKFRYSVYISQCVQTTMCTFHGYFLQQNQSWYQSSLVQFSLLKGMQNYTSVICSVFKFCTMYRFLPSESLSAVCPKTDAPLTFQISIIISRPVCHIFSFEISSISPCFDLHHPGLIWNPWQGLR